ncbi:hypothetical protein IDH44_25530 [Paenibacillus sp. IB182496]|uniref:Beta-galactosidase trimerisation domain-containing protein n=1 Tax=Paenibacillus sabuli TaxID=2772509 RepID=A0A927BZV9_9BACL|nr:alpha-amylase family protein [Paenibacillus sabuli]MBD2848554.1 hypothetical protein [Paenibacillus sabuli]
MSKQDELWWHKPQRFVQTNLQVKDTDKIEPRRLARQMKELGATALVFNVGGIYAWYPSQVEGHHVNEHLPEGRDLLAEVIEACHAEELRLIARLDFSKTDDVVYLRHPDWFVRDAAGQPQIVGGRRPGPWSLLMTTCINGPYRNEAVAIPVLEEVLDRYAVDGIFFNAPHYVRCYCRTCQEKYMARYGEPLPPEGAELAPDWASVCIRDNMDKMYGYVKRRQPDLPMILYYNLYRDNLYARLETADMLCTEPQDVLSEGHQRIPEFWKPALSIKLGRSAPGHPVPLGIVHSSPGMEWRHTGLPPAEYRFWLSQIPAHGGSIWHSLTGLPETITDKRILETVGAFNQQVECVEDAMHGAAPLAEVALMWTADAAAESWADGLINRQIPFDVLLAEQATSERLARYKALILPEGIALGDAFVEVLAGYAEAGGHVLLEGAAPEQPRLLALLGLAGGATVSEPLSAAYLRFEGVVEGTAEGSTDVAIDRAIEGTSGDTDNPLQRSMAQTELIAHRGRVHYVRTASASARVLATLVPPFSPLESVGAPPERASLPVSHTDIPLAVHHRVGRGGAVYLAFSLSALLGEFRLGEHYQLLDNALGVALGSDRLLQTSHYPGLQTTLFEKPGQMLLHLVNGAGRRPLAAALPLHEIAVDLRVEGRTVTGVRELMSGEALPYTVAGGRLRLTVVRLDVWACVAVELA